MCNIACNYHNFKIIYQDLLAILDINDQRAPFIGLLWQGNSSDLIISHILLLKHKHTLANYDLMDKNTHGRRPLRFPEKTETYLNFVNK